VVLPTGASVIRGSVRSLAKRDWQRRGPDDKERTMATIGVTGMNYREKDLSDDAVNESVP
jgi:hypothetical protein